MKNSHRVLTAVLLGFAVLLGPAPLPAQSADSIVQITADAQGLALVPPEQLPLFGTYWLIFPGGINGCSAAPLPMPPVGYPTVYQVADGQFIVDGIAGQGAVTEPVLEAQATTIVNLINQIQGTQAAQFSRQMGMAMDMDAPDIPGGDGDGGMATNDYPYSIDTNLLWLEMVSVTNGLANVNLHRGTNLVYAVRGTTNLFVPFTNWQVETEVWPTGTNCMPFTVPTFGRQDLFLWAQDWTGVDSDGDGVPDWWDWLYFGVTTMNTGILDYSGDNNTFAQDYSNSTPPTVFQFTGIIVTNSYFNFSPVTMQLTVAGCPYYMAVLMDDNNFDDAVWNSYASSNIVVNLGSTEGWHGVWIGLRGHGDMPSAAVWQWVRLKLQTTAPVLVITNPITSAVATPLIQLMGYSTEALATLKYDLSNAAGTVTNQPVMIIGQTYNPNIMDFVTNYFQAFDLPLANGTNAITLYAKDFAGNMTTITTNIIYVANTNPPVMSLLWPQNGMQIGAGSITIQGHVNDPTTTVSLMLVDASGNTSWHGGLTGRDGNFWVQNLQFPTGTNSLTLTLRNGSGSATTNFTVIQNNVALSVNPVSPGDTLVGGTIGVSGYTIWANGVQAAQSNGTMDCPNHVHRCCGRGGECDSHSQFG